MLPPGLSAHAADRADNALLRHSLPTVRTVIRLTVGSCSCDLVRPRHADSREDERHLRDRLRRAGVPREAVLATLERHRRGGSLRRPPDGWPRALAAVVAEHARNAGDAVYILRFGDGATPSIGNPPATRRLRAADVLARPGDWLEEEVRMVVGR